VVTVEASIISYSGTNLNVKFTVVGDSIEFPFSDPQSGLLSWRGIGQDDMPDPVRVFLLRF